MAIGGVYPNSSLVFLTMLYVVVHDSHRTEFLENNHVLNGHFSHGEEKKHCISKNLPLLADECWTISHESSLCLSPFDLCSPTDLGWQSPLGHISEICSNCDLCPPAWVENGEH